MKPFPKKIFVVGFMGAGKTTFAQKIADLLQYDFTDTDTFIEQKTKNSVSKIFNTQGESFFRLLEKEMLKNIQKMDNSVIVSTGGGMGCNTESMQKMKEMGKVIFITAKPGELIETLQNQRENRPLISSLSRQELVHYVTKTLHERTPIYQQAHYHITRQEALTLTKWDMVQLFCQ